MRSAAERRKAYDQGRLAESLCALWLRATGHRVLARDYRTPVGEIDIIAKRGSTLLFVEVKKRTNIKEAAEAVTPRQRERISRAAALFLARNPGYSGYDMRHDVMLLAPGCWPSRIRGAW